MDEHPAMNERRLRPQVGSEPAEPNRREQHRGTPISAHRMRAASDEHEPDDEIRDPTREVVPTERRPLRPQPEDDTDRPQHRARSDFEAVSPRGGPAPHRSTPASPRNRPRMPFAPGPHR